MYKTELMSTLLILVCTLIVFSIPLAYSQQIVPTPPDPIQPPFQLPIEPKIENIPKESLLKHDTSEAELWEHMSSMQIPRSEVAAVAIDEKIYVLGGFDRNGFASDVVEVYDTDVDFWDTVTPMPEKLHHPAAAVYDDKIFVVGGYRDGWEPVNTLYIYDWDTDTWSNGTPMPTFRAALTAQFVDGKLYAIGGANRIALDIVEVYDPTLGTWETKTTMPTAREHLTSAVVGDKIYVIGGRTMSLESNLGSNEVYNALTDSWEILESMPTPRGGIAAAEIAGTVFVFGGESPTQAFDTNEQYIPQEGWFTRDSMPTARHGVGAVKVDDRIYVVAGGIIPGSSVSGITEVYYNPSYIPEFGVLALVVLYVSISGIIIFSRFKTRFSFIPSFGNTN